MKYRLFLCVFAALIAAAKAATHGELIKVGDNVQVSAVNANLLHDEVIADVDPDDPQHLIACSHMLTPEPGNDLRVVVYVSFDGGRNWLESLRTEGQDPFCALGHGSLAYFTPLGRGLYRSTDGGRHWAKAAVYSANASEIDREYIAVDNVSKKHRNAVYINEEIFGRPYDRRAGNRDWVASMHSGVGVYRSADEGKSFEEPVSAYSSNDHFIQTMGPATVMADGTYALMFQELMKSPFDPTNVDREKADKNGWIKVVTSQDGGKTLEHASIVTATKFRYDFRGAGVEQGIAADTSNGPFRNRLYVVWQANQLKRSRIWFSYSDDGGKTWSSPVIVDDSPPRKNPLDGPNEFMPAIAVNNRGVVGIFWYDRRDNPDDLGWYARFTASLDGGDTFLSSVRVSSAPMSFTGRHRAVFNFHFDKTVMDTTVAAGDTVGFAAGPDGIFHAVWVDNRTGYWQLWTVPISVAGTVLRNGSPELAALADVTSNAPVHIGNSFWNWSTGEFECDLFVKNISTTPIAGPLKLRLQRFDSAVGIVDGVKVGNQIGEPGLVLDVSQDGVKPGEWSKPLHLTAHVTVLFGTHDADAEERLYRIFAIDSKTFAPPTKDAGSQ